MKTKLSFAALCVLGAAAAHSPAVAAGDNLVTAVFSKVDPTYQRKKAPDGTFKREYYALSNGGALPGTIRDQAIDKVEFPKLAGILAQELGRQNYFLAKDKKSADVLLVVHWGTTIPFSNGNYAAAVNQAASSMSALGGLGQRAGGGYGVPAADPFAAAAEAALEDDMMKIMMFAKIRDQANIANARLLGYVKEINDVNDIARFAGGGHYYNDLISDIEEPRYYVIVSAYDFRDAVEKNNKKLLWVTRMSMRAHGNSFEDKFAQLLAAGSRQFGQNSGRLLRKFERGVRVDIGEATVVREEPAAPPAPPAEKN